MSDKKLEDKSPEASLKDSVTKKSIPYGFFKTRHPKYKANYWKRCRAFYEGGPTLLEDRSFLDSVFPKHRKESNSVYSQRQSMAFYTNYCGEIIDHLVAKLASDPIKVDTGEKHAFYDSFLADCSPKGGRRKPFDRLVRDAVITAMQCKDSWFLVDMPDTGTFKASSLAEQEASGALDAWVVEVAPESVIDWEENHTGELEWALIMYKSNKRGGITTGRNICREEYWAYNQEGWQKYVIEYPKDKEPKDHDPVVLEAEGFHAFGRVPLVRLELPDGLWAMSKLESVAREHFNKRNALAWSEYKSLLPVLYEFLAPPDALLQGPASDEDRAVAQLRGSGYVQERGDKDRAEWVAPPPAPFTHALDSTNSLRDEMHRVVHQMALSADNKGSMLRRSGESKAQDAAASNVVLEAIGEIARDFAEEVLNMVASGRSDAEEQWSIQGYTDFETLSPYAILEEESVLDTSVEIPSPTFKQIRKLSLVKKLLGDNVSEEDLERIREELESAYTTENELAEFEAQQILETVDFSSEEYAGDDEEPDTGGDKAPEPSPKRSRVMSSTFKKGR